MNDMTMVSCFSGIEGFGLGMGRAGIETKAHIEWEPNRQTVLSHRFPTTAKFGDISDVTGKQIGRPRVITAGFPCKDLSIAKGHREGLAGRHSRYFFEFTRLLAEYQRLIDESDPVWVVVENTPGLLTSNGGRDMATVVRCLEDLGYGWAYRVVDGRSFGSPQKRERVLVVGHRGGDPRPAWAVLGDDRPGDSPSSARHRRGSRPGPGPGPIAQSDGGLVRIWRKGVNPQKSINLGYGGGYRETWVNDGDANTLASSDGGSAVRQRHLIAQAGRIRALTPIEWERLQGFPDNWTEGISPSARYNALGDAMHVGMAEWLGRRIVMVDSNLYTLTA